MSGRGASPEVRAETAQDVNRPAHLFELYLESGVIYATDAWRQVSWNGNTYLANGHFLGFDSIEETAQISAGQTTVSISGVDQSEVAGALLYDYVDRRLVIRKIFFDANGTAIADPVPILDGRCDAPIINEDPDEGTCTISVPVGNHWIDFERRPGRHANHQEQQLHAPGDLFFEFVSEINKEIKWGRT